MEQIDLIMRNVQEIVTEKQLMELIESEKIPSAYAGYEPSGKIHMG
ncbi:MAG: tyrosine--tRNA ligase, partial [Methanosarcinaceae archaeon]